MQTGGSEAMYFLRVGGKNPSNYVFKLRNFRNILSKIIMQTILYRVFKKVIFVKWLEKHTNKVYNRTVHRMYKNVIHSMNKVYFYFFSACVSNNIVCIERTPFSYALVSSLVSSLFCESLYHHFFLQRIHQG